MSRVLNRMFVRTSLLAALLLAAPAAATAAPKPVADGWSRWEVPMQAGSGSLCCWSYDSKGGQGERGCRLDEGGRGDGLTVQGAMSAPSSERLSVYVRLERGEVKAIRSFGSDCPVETTARLHELPGLDAATSVAWLRGQLQATRKSVGESALTAIAFHAGREATATLIGEVEGSGTQSRREQALFWLGQARGEEGLPTVIATARDGKPDKLREHALFVLSQSDLPEARDVLRERVREDGSARVRGQGLFWLAQVDDAEALPVGLALLADPAQHSAHDDAVFALSQLPDGRGVDALIAIVEGDYSRKAKKNALFWLGQSDSDKALRYLDNVLAAAAQ